ncbi:phosphate ABC transporter permease PstA [Nocardioides conyzicola]|uniref:Phosphate transport system permease protein PstA n=1 Tax=Nocardioides conyzicola TaxID=1651781 RepID=A0ABP8XP88_9ACTN
MTVVVDRPQTTQVPGGATVLPRTDPDAPPPQPRTGLGQVPAESLLVVWGSRVGALCLAWIICQRLLPLEGIAWFVVVFGISNLVLLATTTAVTDGLVEVRDRVAQWLISAGALLVFATLFSVVIYVFYRGWDALSHINFFTDDMTGVGPDDPLDQGGILHAILGTLVELSIAIAITLPLGIGTAIFMTEIGGAFARVVRTVVEAMTALPSIVAGLFIYTTWIIVLGNPRSGLAGALAISVMMLPIIARASDVVLRVVPGNLREASLALGSSRWKTVWHVVLPTARPGLATALILGVARGVGETSPVLITSGYASFVHLNPTSGVMTSLPLSVYVNVRSGQELMIARGFGTAAVLLMLVLILFITARLLARPAGSKPRFGTRVMRAMPRATWRPVRTPEPGADAETRTDDKEEVAS